MGDSRSWAAEKEDEITVCIHGAESRYFDTCRCEGCKADRDEDYNKKEQIAELTRRVSDVLYRQEAFRRKQLIDRFQSMLDEL